MGNKNHNKYGQIRKTKNYFTKTLILLICFLLPSLIYTLIKLQIPTLGKVVTIFVVTLFSAFIVAFLYLILNMWKKTEIVTDKNQLYQSLLNEMQQGLALHEIITDEQNNPIDYRYIGINPKFEKMLGIKEEDIIGKTVLELFPKTENIWIKEFGEVALTGKAKKIDDFFITTGKYYEVYVYSPKPRQFATIIYDVTDSKKSTKQLHEEKVLLETTLISVGDGVISTDKDQHISLMNNVAQLLTGYSFDEAKGKLLQDIFKPINEITSQKCTKEINNVFKKEQSYEFAENILLISKNGIEVPIEGIISPIKEIDNTLNGAVLVFRDFSERKKKQDEIEYLSLHDKLTGLYNRRFFDEECKRVDTKRNYPLSIVMADINGLKLLNDAYGHSTGDELLVAFADIMKEHIRADDIVARIGGDEFVLLLPSTTTREALQIVNRMKEKMSKKTICHIPISAAFGCETKKEEKISFLNVYQQAEASMYKSKLKESDRIKKETLKLIIKQLHDKYPFEKEHAEEVANLCKKTGKALALNETEINTLEQLGFYHNIGNINNSIKTLQKDSDASMELHIETGYQILRSVNEYADISNYVLQHHEQWDGKGFPRGLQKEEIAIHTRILSIADSYDLMIRSKDKKPISKEAAITKLVKSKGKEFDPHIVDVFINKVI